mmetsp:Transcript_46743/g.109024  ORF Transcript_46743/g.109024 Transcript_46743/m.109024 type:complete len:289 (+) Transcript_46743:74-940(+)
MLARNEPVRVWRTDCEGLESQDEVLSRVRRRLNAARVQKGMSWESLFKECDANNSGTLDWKEMKSMARKVLGVPSQTVCEYELKVLFCEIDRDASGSIDVAEMLEYLQHGARRPEDEAARLEVRIERVRRNVQMAFQKLGNSEAEIRNLFKLVDMDDSCRLSQYEFNFFVRHDLGMSRWHIKNSDLDDFYHYLDRDGDGIDINELLGYVKQARKNKDALGAQAFYKGPSGMPISRRKRKTFKEELEEGFRKSDSQPHLRLGMPFAGLGRDRPPTTRSAVNLRTFMMTA